MKVQNMISARGNTVPNQFEIYSDNGVYFQSYQTVIAFRPVGYRSGGQPHERIHLDRDAWDYSVTTSKYRNQFLGENKTETQRKIDSGEYILTDLNR